MDELRSYIKQIKKSSRVFIAVGVVVLAVLIGAYIDLQGVPPVESPEVEVVSTSTNATPGTIAAAVKTTHYEDTTYGYSFDYPSILETGENQRMATNYFGGITEDSLFTASFPDGYGKGTNLTSATLMAGVKKVKESVCLPKAKKATSTPGRIPPLPVTIGDIDFVFTSESDPGAGNLYTTTEYRTFHEGRCYSVALVTHSFNDVVTYNQDHPTSTIKVYDQNKYDAMLDRVMQSFAFAN